MQSITFIPDPAHALAYRGKEFTLNLAQAAGTYDLCTASGGDVLIDLYNLSLFCTVAGATFTSVAVQTNDTTPAVILTAVEGGVANITAGKNITRAVTFGAILLRSGQKIQYTIDGSTGTGTVVAGISFCPLTGGATIA